MSYLLDTNAVVALLRNRPPVVRSRFQEAAAKGEPIAVSSVVQFELWYGAEKSDRIAENIERLRVFLSGDLEMLDFDDEDAQVAGRVRARLERAGTPIGAYDLLIAGQALRRGLTLVTANVSEFRRVPGLIWVDWSS